MDNGTGRNPMVEAVYSTEDANAVMSEKVICELKKKSIDRCGRRRAIYEI